MTNSHTQTGIHGSDGAAVARAEFASSLKGLLDVSAAVRSGADFALDLAGSNLGQSDVSRLHPGWDQHEGSMPHAQLTDPKTNHVD